MTPLGILAQGGQAADVSRKPDEAGKRRAIAARLKAAIKAAAAAEKLSVRAWAIAHRLDPNEISRWTSGRHVVNSLRVAELVALLSVSADWLLGGDAPEFAAWHRDHRMAPDAFVAFARGVRPPTDLDASLFYDAMLFGWTSGVKGSELAKAAAHNARLLSD